MVRFDWSYEMLSDGVKAVGVGAVFFLAPGLIVATIIAVFSFVVS